MTEQRTEEWFAARLGKVTASRVADATAKTKSGWSASRANYMAELIAERMTGRQADRFNSPAMQWGTDNEEQARDLYAFMTDCEVEEVGFVDHPIIEMSGASPDGYVGSTGLVEIKCPNTATHLDTLLGSEIDGRYIKQMQWQMACTGRAFCNFVSFDPRLPERMQIHIQRVERNDELITQLEAEVTEFLAELAAKEAALREKFDISNAA